VQLTEPMAQLLADDLIQDIEEVLGCALAFLVSVVRA
jgi:hypothetical protein